MFLMSHFSESCFGTRVLWCIHVCDRVMSDDKHSLRIKYLHLDIIYFMSKEDQKGQTLLVDEGKILDL